MMKGKLNTTHMNDVFVEATTLNSTVISTRYNKIIIWVEVCKHKVMYDTSQ
jgi:hypothetical protein